MKENKNIVFALQAHKDKSTDKTNPIFEKEGFLLFPDEKKAEEFLDMCETINKNKGYKTCHYEKFSYTKVSDFVGDKVHNQKNFYVGKVEAYTPTEEDFKSKPQPVVEKKVTEEEDVEQ